MVEEAALEQTVTIGEGDDAYTGLLADIYGVDLPKAIIATSGDLALYTTRTATTASTPLEGISRKAKSIDKKTGEVTDGSDPDAVYVHKRLDVMRDGRDLVPGYKGKVICASPDIAHNIDASTLDIPHVPGVPLAFRVHNRGHSGTEVLDAIRILRAREHHLQTIVADLGFTDHDPERWAVPAHRLGIDLVHDLTEHNRTPNKDGKWTWTSPHRTRRLAHTFTDDNGEPVSELVIIDGELYEHHMLAHMKKNGWDDIAKPQFPNENTPEHPNRTEETAAIVKAFEERSKLRFRYLDTPRPGVYRIQGPAHGKSRTLWCANHPRTFAGKGKVPQSPCRKGDPCHCNTTLTLDETVNAKLRQRSVWNSADWKARYKPRNQVETFWGLPKASYGNWNHPAAIRLRGLTNRAAATYGILAAMSLRLIAANRIERGLPPHPKITGPPGHAPPKAVAA